MSKSSQLFNWVDSASHARSQHFWGLTRVCTPEHDGDANLRLVYFVCAMKTWENKTSFRKKCIFSQWAYQCCYHFFHHLNHR